MFKIFKIKKSLTLAIFSIFIIGSAVFAGPFDLFKLNNDTVLNLVQISDVHLDIKTKNGSTRMFEESENLLKDAVCQINNFKDTDLVVFSGDVVNRSDKQEFAKFSNIANQLNIPWYYAPGSHDIGIFGGISKKEMLNLWLNNSKLFNTKSLSFDNNKSLNNADNFIYYSVSPNNNFLILFMDGVITDRITAKGYFPRQELDWLDKQLKCNPEKKVIIVQHFPVVEPYKDNGNNSHKVINAAEYLKITDKYNNVIAVLSGHYHATKITQRKNVLHISTPSLVQYPNAFRKIKITRLRDSVKFDIKFIETGLKNINRKSKAGSKNYSLEEGTSADRNAEITIKTT